MEKLGLCKPKQYTKEDFGRNEESSQILACMKEQNNPNFS
jgi:hypothetical protein